MSNDSGPRSQWWLFVLVVVASLGCTGPTGEAGGAAGIQADAPAQHATDSAGLDQPDATAEPDDGSDVAVGDADDETAVASDLTSQSETTDSASLTTAIWVHYPQPLTLTLRGSASPLSWTDDWMSKSIAPKAAYFEVPGNAASFAVKPLLAGAWSVGSNYVVTGKKQRTIYPYFDPKLAAPRRDDFAVAGPDGKPRTLRVRLPAGYDENSVATYRLLVMLDGQNVFDAQTATFGVAWEVDEAIDKAMLAAKSEEYVVAAIDHAGAARINEYTPWASSSGQGGGGPAFFQWVHTAVLPALATKYRLQSGASARTIGGSSLGGLMSLYAVGAYPEHWSGAIAMSGSWWWADLKTLTWIASAPGTAQHPKIWLDVGTVKDGLQDAQALRKVLLQLGWVENQTLGYYEAAGGDHSETAWAARVHLPLWYFFDPKDRAPAF